MKINPINFKGIYHYKINEREEPEKFSKILATRQKEEELEMKIVLDHQNYDSIMCSFEGFMNRFKEAPSINWLVNHAKRMGIKLPEYISKDSYNIFVLTEKDKEDYEKTLAKRENFSKANRIIKKVARQVKKDSPRDTTCTDAFIRMLNVFYETEQKKFDEFIKDRQIEPMYIEIGENGDIYFLDYNPKA